MLTYDAERGGARLSRGRRYLRMLRSHTHPLTGRPSTQDRGPAYAVVEAQRLLAETEHGAGQYGIGWDVRPANWVGTCMNPSDNDVAALAEALAAFVGGE